MHPVVVVDSTRARLDTVCPDVLARIAFYVASSSATGPPADLLALLLTSKSIYSCICLPANYALYAHIFTAKFDVRAVKRRFAPRWSTARCLAHELVKRCHMLRRMRRRQIISLEQLTDDLWTAYLMMFEHDEHNRAQLVQSARIYDFLWHTIFWSFQTRAFDWFKHCEIASLVVWLFWMIMDRDDLVREDPRLRREMQKLLHPFMVANFEYPSFHASDLHQLLPLCPVEVPPPPPSSASYKASPRAPPVRTLTHYNHPLTLACPPLTAGATLCSAARTEVQLHLDTAAGVAGWRVHTQSPQMEGMTRAQRDAAGREGPTWEDMDEWEGAVHVKCEESRRSAGWDGMWFRLVGCCDPYGDGGALRGIVYQFGSIAGRWRGRWLTPSFQSYQDLLRSEDLIRRQLRGDRDAHPLHIRALSVFVNHRPIYCTFKEHHCLSHQESLDYGEDEYGNNLLNAWLPQGTRIQEHSDHLEIYDPVYDRLVRYETLAPPGSAQTYLSKSAKFTEAWQEEDEEEEEEEAEDDDPESTTASYIDDEDWEDTLTQKTTGVCDIIITGQTDRVHGAAWGHYTFVGRVRPWDGLICLLRRPMHPELEHGQGSLVFRGYIQGNNLVGQWRDVNTSLELVGWECGFVMRKDAADSGARP